jgi:hypothetical protein
MPLAFKYIPILKWKQAEQIALREATIGVKQSVLPLVALQPVAPKAQQTMQAAQKDYLSKCTASLLKSGFDKYPVAVDSAMTLPASLAPVKVLVTLCTHFQRNSIQVVPVVDGAVVDTHLTDLARLSAFADVVLRIRIDTISSGQISSLIASARKAIGSPSVGLHVLLDMWELVGTDQVAEAARALPYVSAAVTSRHVRSITIAGGSFPHTLTGIRQGTSFIPRIELSIWKSLHAKPDLRDVCFGDYTVTNPRPLEPVDPRQINPSVAIRYARDTDWMLMKAGGSRTSGMGQYNQVCKLLVQHSSYSGATFCYGDKQYHKHSQAGSTSGSYMSWRRDATSHHIEFTKRQLDKGIAP